MRSHSSQILLVDDDHALLEALSGTLQLHLGHFTLDTRDTGLKGLASVTTNHYDTIITDMNMPGMSGLEFLIRVKEAQPQAPIVVISGHADPTLIAKALDAGASDFIAKPIERDSLMRTVRQTLNVSRLHRLLERQQALISRTQDHYLRVVDKFGDSNKQWIGWVENILRDSSLPISARMRRIQAEQHVHVLSNRATRHLALLDAFLVKVTHAHCQTSDEVNAAQERLRRLASTRPDAR